MDSDAMPFVLRFAEPAPEGTEITKTSPNNCY